MKILHGLVGYLAVTALPFHPFAFASPLAAIDYDGYVTVDTTHNPIDDALMKHVLNNILETCQTVTSTYHSGYVNTMKNHSDIIETRFGPEVIPPVVAVIALVAAVTLSILWIESDDPVRGNDVEFLVKHCD